MTEDHANNTQGRTRKVSIRERSVRVGERIVVNGARADLALLKERFAQGGYRGHETAHFVLFTRAEPPKQILVHRLFPDAIAPQTAQDLLHELESLGSLAQRRDVGEALAGVMATTHYPDDLRRAWNGGDAQAVQRLLVLLCSSTPPILPDFVTLSQWSALYQRACIWGIGLRVLDLGGSHGFAPLHLCERMPWASKVIGLEHDTAVCAVAKEMAEERHLTALHFLQADLSSREVQEQGPFETVLALHVLEHVTETDLYPVLCSLLHLCARRLILAVPPGQKGAMSGEAHRRVLSPARLEAVGPALLHQLSGGGRMWWDEMVDGLLIIERDAAGARTGKEEFL